MTICCKCVTETELIVELGGKSVAERRDEIVFVKSAGVTSETNQGNSLGLVCVTVRVAITLKRKFTEYDVREVWGVSYETLVLHTCLITK